ncbi:hypothetical protein JCM3775_004777 [Rhodotorula graminis]
MEPGTTPLADAPVAHPPHLHPRAKKLPLSRNSPSPPPSLDLGTPSSTAMLEVSHDYDADASDTDEPHERRAGRGLEVKGTMAAVASPRTRSPASLLWGESGWHAGSFSFPSLATVAAAAVAAETPTPHASPDQHFHTPFSLEDLGVQAQVGGDQVKAGQIDHEDDGPQASNSSADVVHQAAATAAPVHPTRSKKLTPTAEPFSPRATTFTPVSPRPDVPRLGINTALSRYSFPAAHAYNDEASVASSPVDPHTPSSAPLRHWSLSSSTSSRSQFDYDGHLLSQGAKYTIADEILQLQSAPLGRRMLDSDDDMEVLADVDELETGAMRMRAASEDLGLSSAAGHWRHPQSYGGRPVRSANGASFAHARSSSIASSSDSSFYSPTAVRPVFARAQTAAQLKTYFGAPQDDPSSVHLPDDHDAYLPLSPAASVSGVSYRSSQASFGGTYPPLAHPEPFNLTRDDALYLEARDLFVESTCTSLTTPVTDEHLDKMAQHFDHAMDQLHPLATLFGLSQDAADRLLADPDNSGVDDVVLKVAAMMGRQQQLASTQRSAMGVPLPGPSPNNRKTELYKTEGCRSWDELEWCKYGEKCQFAHGIRELRYAPRHAKFKSEICRTFWEDGACPYGRRCCFIHAAPDGTAPSSPSASRKGSTASSRAQSPGPHGRMTSTAVTTAPSRTFGPALSELLGSASHSSSSSAAQSSPVEARAPLPGGSSSSSSTGSSFETSTLFGLGIRERPGQAPATYRDAPQSRLQRLASLSAHGSSSSLASLGAPLGPRGSISSFGSGAPRGSTASLASLASPSYAAARPNKQGPVSPPSASSRRFFTGASHARQDSAASFMSSGSSAAAPLSPFLARNDSSSSLSSAAASPMLHRVGGDWLSGTAHGAMSAAYGKGALDWPEIEELCLDDPPAPTGSSLHGRA